MRKPSDVGNGHIQAHPHHCHIQQQAFFRHHFFTIRSSLCRFRFVALGDLQLAQLNHPYLE